MNTRPLLLALGLLFAAAASPAAESAAPATAPTPTPTVKPYPLDTCLVTENELGSMGDERSFVYQGQQIKICCKPCEKKFLKNPEKYLARLPQSKG